VRIDPLEGMITMARNLHDHPLSRRQLIRPDQLDHHSLFDLLSRVASLYYLEEKTQEEIGRELGLSRQKVQRLLRQAREQRIVEIHVHAVPVLHMELENKLKATFHLRDAIVAPSHPDEQRCRDSVAQAAASYLERHLSAGSVVAVGLGRNTDAVSKFIRPPQQIDCTFVSAMGGSPHLGASINPNEVCSKLAARTGGRVQLLYAPAYVESRRVRDMLLTQETISQTMVMARQANIALMGLGTPNDDSILVQAGCLSLAEARRLRDIGAVGEILGNFFDKDGRSVSSDLDGRLIGLSLNDLRQIQMVIAVASEAEKSQAMLGALRTGVIRTLVTECQNAVTVLRLAGVTDLEEEKTLLGEKPGYV